MSFDSDNVEKVEHRESEVDRAFKQEINDLREVMKSKAGRRFMFRLLGWTHPYQTSLVGPNNQVFAMEGERNIGIKLIVKLEQYCFEDYIRMKREHGAK